MDQQDNKLFVGNVAYATEIQTLVDMFSEFGTVTDSYKPQQKGFAFITFETAEQAQAAIEALNGKEVDGRELNISVAKPREPRSNNFGGGQGGGNRGGFGGGNSRGGYGGGQGGNRGRDNSRGRDRY